MRRKFWYLVGILILSVAVVGPTIYAHRLANDGSSMSLAESRDGPSGSDHEGKGRVTPALPPAADQGCRVYVAVVGKGKQVLFGPAQVSLSSGQKWGATALGALDATGLEYHLAYGNKFVDMVAGQANQGQWGWMYKVNDQVIWKPAVDVEVKPGDKIIWWYSQDRSPGPIWSELSK
ncbi:MAG: DUF4430 domain-containing protein [Clostridia bacterium]|nr:DUF4430 domain-containing protein [Clostridia bacterium]